MGAGIISAGVVMAKLEDTRFGAYTFVIGGAVSLAAMAAATVATGGGALPAVGAAKTAGGAMQNFGQQHAGFNVQNMMSRCMPPQQQGSCVPLQAQVPAQMQMVRKKKKKESKDSTSASAGSSSD